MNSRSDDGIQRDKVVVIDDPVSSMDSSALFSVAALAYINTGAAGFDDGLYFDQSSVSDSQLRSVFKNIFYVLKQDQHYDYMMR